MDLVFRSAVIAHSIMGPSLTKLNVLMGCSSYAERDEFCVYGFASVNDSWVEAKIYDVIKSWRIEVVMEVLVGTM